MPKTIIVKAFDAQRVFKYSWPTRLIAQEGDLLILHGDWGRLLHHTAGEKVHITNQSLEFYSLSRPYAISALLDRQGTLQEYYGQVTLPPLTYESGREISFVMLGLDLQVKPSFDYEILDRTGKELSERAGQGLIELVELIERREGPFDQEYLRPYLQQVRQGL
ncbi:MAG: hypothetical protein A2Z21_10800 [Candidatus Fraserbacteria bacterium RBG_16_55_9]|uniref:DUF402 domain-containing protein n=1 Tax=Fraserbacteria sp. (strain RBG_16_55_9) TaxID=1817864 RepID=A0A1F5V2H1_FRAXR|nr:MAG: hypothetical protein A2Z21_10800 [Candidatus Fraserbacteria bacterium RBG_16_55_9]